METIIEKITQDLQTLKEDKPSLIITDEIIQEYIEENMKEIIKKIKENL